MSSAVAVTPAPRQLYVDNLRVLLTVLVVGHHSAISWGAAGGWYYVIAPPEGSIAPLLLTFFVAINQAFFMGLFFLLSAFFTPASHDKKGGAVFLKDRLLRLGVPLLFFFFVLNPSLVFLTRRFSGTTIDGYLHFMLHSGLRSVGTGPLWFVLALLLFAGVYAAVKRLRGPAGSANQTRPVPTNLAIVGFVVGVSIVAFIVRIWWPTGAELLGLQLGYFPLYISMYIFGVWAHRYGWLDTLTERQASTWFRGAMGFILCLPIVMTLGATDAGVEAFSGGLSWQALVYAAWEPTVCIGVSMKLLVVFRDRFNRAAGLLRSMSRSAYTAYIIHPFFVILGTYWLSEAPMPPLAKFAILVTVASCTCFAVSDVLRRAPLLRKIL